jgi:hypothetical protein
VDLVYTSVLLDRGIFSFIISVSDISNKDISLTDII